MSRILFLDDDPERHVEYDRDRARHNEIVHVYTVDDAIAALNGKRFDLASLDFDLNDHAAVSVSYGMYGKIKLTGADVAHHLVSLPLPRRPPHVHIHSWNVWGSDKLESILKRRVRRLTRAEFKFPKWHRQGGGKWQ